MKVIALVVAGALVALPGTFARAASPVAKVMELMSQMQAKITAEGKDAEKTFHEFQEWCEDESRKLSFALKTEKGEKSELQATIEEQTATQTTLTAKVAKVVKTISAANSELEEATTLRKKEAADFAAESKELSEAISLVGKAILILKREAAKGSASMVQVQSANSLTQALDAIVQASMFSSTDAARVASFGSLLEDDDEELGAPASPAYESHSSGLISSLEGMLEKAKKQLAKIQKEESTALHDYEMLKQSLEGEISVGESDRKKTKTNIATSTEKTSTAKGELEDTNAEIQADVKSKEDLQAECMEKARDYEMTSKSREEELEALSAAKKAIAESTGGAEKSTYGFIQPSLLQLNHMSHTPNSVRVPLAAVRHFREVASQQHSATLAQLASRMATAVSLSTMQGSDPFKKVRDMIADLLAKVEKEAAADATQDAFCDKELSESSAKKDKKDTEIGKLSTKIEQMTSKSAKLKEQVATLRKELSDIANSQSEMDTLRKEENAAFVKNKADLEDGLEGVKLALKVLRDFYGKKDHAHGASGSSSGLIAMIEVCESDFSKGLSEAISTEEASQKAYEEQSSDNKLDTATKEKAAAFKTTEAANLNKAVTELTTDRSGVQEELDAVLEYLDKLKEQCIGKPDSFEDRKKQREAEIASLKEGLEILEGEAALVQNSAKRSLRGLNQRSLSP